jgi:2-keto-4-pentenoate hydratase
MVWLANALSARGLGLAAGQVATLGSITLSQPLSPGQFVVADYGRFGTINLHVAAG